MNFMNFMRLLRPCWKVICDFVGKEIPEKSWPHKNKKGAITKEIFEDRNAKIPKHMQKRWRRNMGMKCLKSAVILQFFLHIITFIGEN